MSFDFTDAMPAGQTKIAFFNDLTQQGDGSADWTIYIDNLAQFKPTPTIALPVNFEEAADAYEIAGFDGGVASIEAGPDNANSLKYIKGVGQNWAGVWINLDTAVDAANGQIITANVHSTVAREIALKFDAANVQRTANHGGTGWEAMSFDFTDAMPAGQTKIAFFNDLTQQGDGSADWTIYIDNLAQTGDTGGGGDTTTYCDTQVTHFNIEAETASAIKLTIVNSGADKITVSAEGVNSPIDLLFVGAPAAGGTSSTTTITNGVASFDITWAEGTMPATTTFELLWSTEAEAGNWMIRSGTGTGTDGLGNIDTSNVCGTAGINEVSGFSVVTYPNPVENTLNVRAGVAIDTVSIFDLTGREVMRAAPNATAFSLDVADLNKGLYLVTVKAGEQELTTKLVK
jgi:peroxiredoxin